MRIAIGSTNLHLIEVRNNAGQMVSLGALADVREVGGPILITRYNLYTAAAVNGTRAAGFQHRRNHPDR